jgi:predicted GNAT family N-acyltransferase
MDSAILVKAVSWEEASAVLLVVRRAVFVVEQGVAEEREVDEHDPESVHFLATDPSGEPLGTARLLPSGRVGRVAVRRDLRRQGIGRALMEAVCAAAAARGEESLRLHAQVESIPFYESLGYVASGAVFEEEGIPHREMELRLPERRLPELPLEEGRGLS